MKQHEHATQNEHKTEPSHDEVVKTAHAGPAHHAHMAADFRKRFWISLVLTVPILVLSPMLQSLVGLRDVIHFPGDLYNSVRPAVCGRTLPRQAAPPGGGL